MATQGRSAARFDRHKLHRRGVRALVDDADEVFTGKATRRFRKVENGVEHVFLLDRTTELLVGEEFRSPSDTTLVRHEWTQVAPGDWARTHTSMESTDVFDGKPVRSRVALEVRNLRIAGAPAPKTAPQR